MCGIAGFWKPSGLDKERSKDIVVNITNTLAYRGPDDAGFWYDAKVGIGLGHRRLSIIDLSAQGRQPMISESGRYVIAYNGEVYNFRDLKKSFKQKAMFFAAIQIQRSF